MSEIPNDLKLLFDNEDNWTFSKIKKAYKLGKSDAEAEHKAMCESCIHKVGADDLSAIKYDAVDELSIKCITHIQEAKPLTIEEIIHIIRFETDQMKGE